MKFDELRDYQRDCIDQLRSGIREGHRSQLLVAPTGSGKTVMAAYLLGEAYNKGSRAFFVCDRVSLVDQTSNTLDKYGIKHGVIQADHWRNRPWETIQVVSAQTLARRKIDPPSLILWDESHTMYKSVMDYCQNMPVKVVGLTATPFTKGLANVFSNVVNSTTTDKLIEEKWLVPLKCYAAKELDMTGAKVKFSGEWEDKEMEERGIKIVGDVVEEWITKTNQYFDGPAKTIAFSATVAHGAEMCKMFQQRGYNFQQISYLDGNTDRRRELIEEFRKPDSQIIGLVSCEALAKGFDVTDIKVGIGARPYRKSLSGHIQQIGRVMRSHEGKTFALWLDHAGNLLRFLEDTQEVFANGVSDLNDSEYDKKVRKEKTEAEKKDSKCHACGFIHTQRICPACGTERVGPKSRVELANGRLTEVDLSKKKVKLNGWMEDKRLVWRELCWIANDIKKGHHFSAEKFALAQYRSIYGVWPQTKYSPETAISPRAEVRSKVKSNLIAFSRRMKVA
jgi:superfamily II DNA or RNA helicase